jgi:hypothetical protein
VLDVGVDFAFDDPILDEPEVVLADDVLAFAGIAPPTLRLYPVAPTSPRSCTRARCPSRARIRW